jgi:RNA polymerase sigma-70 factor, ECF subfamily
VTSDDVLIQGLAKAREAHPGLVTDEAGFLEFVRSKLTDASPDDLFWADLAIAFGCLRGERGALDAFDRAYGGEIDFALKKSPTLGMQSADFRQLVRQKLFVSEADRDARIAAYAGRGPLKSWVRVTVARMVIDLARSDDPERPASDEGMFDRIPSAGDPEAAVLQVTSRAELRTAMKNAFDKLTVRQRNLLRQRFLFDLPGDRIAALYQVHRATAFGWIEDARKALVSNVRAELSGGRSKGRELESILALLGSRLDVSLRGVIGEQLED